MGCLFLFDHLSAILLYLSFLLLLSSAIYALYSFLLSPSLSLPSALCSFHFPRLPLFSLFLLLTDVPHSYSFFSLRPPIFCYHPLLPEFSSLAIYSVILALVNPAECYLNMKQIDKSISHERSLFRDFRIHSMVFPNMHRLIMIMPNGDLTNDLPTRKDK